MPTVKKKEKKGKNIYCKWKKKCIKCAKNGSCPSQERADEKSICVPAWTLPPDRGAERMRWVRVYA